MIKLDAGTIWFVGGHERNAQRWILLVGVVEKENFFPVQPTREEGIPPPPDGFANRADGEQVINGWHTKLIREIESSANLVSLGRNVPVGDESFRGKALLTSCPTVIGAKFVCAKQMSLLICTFIANQ